jgi:DNA polymerase elongation subunit (family B)
MVKSTEQKLDELLEITEKVPVKKETKVIVPRPKDDEDVSADYKYSRENFYNLVERGQDAIDGILELANLKEVPNSAPKNVTNALFVGSTAELQKMIKKDG